MKCRFAALALALLAGSAAQGQVNLTQGSPTYSQDFSGGILPSNTDTVNWTDNSTIPNWYAQYGEPTAGAITVRGNTGGSALGTLFSYDEVAASTDRALGSRNSDSATDGIAIALRLKNNDSHWIKSLRVRYTGKQFRDSNTDDQATDFYYQVGSDFSGGIPADTAGATIGVIDPAGFTKVAALSFTSPQSDGTNVTLDPALTASLDHTFSVEIDPGEEILLVWLDHNHSGGDHAMAIDDVIIDAVTFDAVPVELDSFVID